MSEYFSLRLTVSKAGGCRGNMHTAYACPVCILVRLSYDRTVAVTRLRGLVSLVTFCGHRVLRGAHCYCLLFQTYS